MADLYLTKAEQEILASLINELEFANAVVTGNVANKIPIQEFLKKFISREFAAIPDSLRQKLMAVEVGEKEKVT